MMKKINRFVIMSVITLIGAVGFTACSSSDEVVEVNPNYNAEDNTVGVQFAFNVSTGNTPTTRMSDANTQADLNQVFRGITNANLLTYKLTDDGKRLATATEAGKVHSLPLILRQGELNQSTSSTTTKSRRVVELALQNQTNTILFYGKAIKTGTDAQQGKIDFHVEQNITNNSFKLAPRLTADASSTVNAKFETTEKLISTILTHLAKNGYNGSETWNRTTITVTFVNDAGTTESFNGAYDWSDYGTAVKGSGMSPVSPTVGLADLEEILGNAYNTFTEETDMRAGSGKAVRHTVMDLRAIVNKVKNAIPTTLAEAAAQKMAERIITRIDAYFSSADNTWKSMTDIQTTLNTNLTTEEQIAIGDYSSLSASLEDFPSATFGIPDGAVQLYFNPTTMEFSYKTNSVTSTTDVNQAYNYMYPAELCYFGNSPIRVNDNALTTNQYPDGVANWDDLTNSGWSGWTKNGRVVATTRSVAMQENINYGTSLLKTTVGYLEGVTTLNDNNKHFNTAEDDNSITVSGSTFILKGIIIGGQAQEMGWNYIAKSSTFDKMIYDSDIVSAAIPETGEGTPNYTLVFDNWNEAIKGGKQNDVYVALEFENRTGAAFYGKDNLVPAGGTFYLIGKLDPDEASAAQLSALGTNAAGYTADKSLGITWPGTTTGTTMSPYALPPYDTDGSTVQERRVFIQDYMTTANFKIGTNSLKYAYNTIPDLRSAQISFGLSVDLEWQTGLTFENILLGGE